MESISLQAMLDSPFFLNSPDGILVVDSSGSIVAANRQLVEMLGYHPHDLIGRPVEVLVPGQHRSLHELQRTAYFTQPHRRAIGSGLQLAAVHSDGEEVAVDIALSAFEVAGAMYTMASVRDARQRLAAEAAIAQADEWRAIIDDRQRIARDLHDTVIQDIFAAGMGLQALQRRIPEDDLREQLGTNVSHLDSVITRLRKVIFNLTQGDEAESFDTATRRVVAESLKDTEINLELEIHAADGRLPPRTQEHVLATLQEALSNVVRHAAAKTVAIEIDATTDVCRLLVADDGMGMPDAAATRPGFGLTNMLNRAQVLGGSCDITPNDGGGTVVEWKVPI